VGDGTYERAMFLGPEDSTPLDAQHHHPHIALICLLPRELTSLSLVKPRDFCTQEGRKEVRAGLLFWTSLIHHRVQTQSFGLAVW